MVILLPVPLVFLMWAKALPLAQIASVGDEISLVLVTVAIVSSVISFAKALGSQYDLKGNRAGVLLSVAGVITYLLGTSLQSNALHLFSIAVFYWGCVLSLGGFRPLISTVPGGLLMVSLFVPTVSSLWGAAYLEGLSWGLIVVSAVLLLNSRRGTEPLGCGLCASFRKNGESFCSSCGRLVGRTTVIVPRRAVTGLVAFTIMMAVLLTLTVPLLTVTPTVSFTGYGLGGPQSRNGLPLVGWSYAPKTFTIKGQQLGGYVLANGKASMDAYVAHFTDPAVAASALVLARGNSSNTISLPPSVGQQMSGYTLALGGATYVGVQGFFQVATLNGSQPIQSFVAVDLKQTSASFQEDNGTALYGASNAVIGWASSSEILFPFATYLVSAFQFFSQAAYFVSFAAVVVILFTLARDDELSKVRMQESSSALTKSEAKVMSAFAPGSGWTTGEHILESARVADPGISDSVFFEALDGVSRRGLVRSSVILRNGRPTLLWRSLV